VVANFSKKFLKECNGKRRKEKFLYEKHVTNIMDKKTVLLAILIFSILFSGCNQKLTEKQLEEKAK